MFNHPESTQSIAKSLQELREELNNASRIVAHNIKFDLLWLLHHHFDVSKFSCYCTQVAEYILRGQQGGKGQLTLEQLSKDYNIADKIDKVKLFWESGYETDEIPSSILIPYGEQDCINTLAIYQRQVPQIIENGMEALFTLQMELAKTLAIMEYNGMMVDKELCIKYSEEYREKIEHIDRQILSIFDGCNGFNCSEYINLNSGEHLSAALYGGVLRYDTEEPFSKTLKDGRVKESTKRVRVETSLVGAGFQFLPKTELKKLGYYETNLEVLKQLKCKTTEQKELIRLLIEKSRLEKLRGTYFEGLQDKIQSDSCVHPSFNQTLTKTGRLSCSKPNLQNQPRGSTGPSKEIFITRY